jgi:hypothetical protein
LYFGRACGWWNVLGGCGVGDVLVGMGKPQRTRRGAKGAFGVAIFLRPISFAELTFRQAQGRRRLMFGRPSAGTPRPQTPAAGGIMEVYLCTLDLSTPLRSSQDDGHNAVLKNSGALLICLKKFYFYRIPARCHGWQNWAGQWGRELRIIYG